MWLTLCWNSCLTNLPTFRWYDPQKHTAPTTKQLNFNSSCSPCHTRGRLLFRTGRINSWLAKEDKRIQPANSQWSKVHWWHFILPSWWFQPIWKILVNWDNFPKWVFPKIGVPQNGWFIWKSLSKWMIWGYHLLGNPQIGMNIKNKYLSCHHLVTGWRGFNLQGSVRENGPTVRVGPEAPGICGWKKSELNYLEYVFLKETSSINHDISQTK